MVLGPVATGSLGTCWKCQCSGPLQGYLIRHFGEGTQRFVLTSPQGDSDASESLRTTEIGNAGERAGLGENNKLFDCIFWALRKL